MHPPHLAQFAPLHKGRSFICYRDVNKAIERHREIYGLRLVLKKAIRLENYCLTVDQMRDLNFRLKYGELDYQCSVDNGRPGRPGNDERCPRLVRLRLSPDARTLVVYDTHIHEPVIKKQSHIQGLSPPCPLQEPLLDTSSKDEAPKGKALSHSVPPTPTTTLSSPTYRPSPGLEKGNILTSTPNLMTTSSPAHEKITMKIKKSQFSPNEMVVVGSARDTQEQLELRNTPEKTYSQPSAITGEQTDPAALARQFVQNLQAGNAAVVLKPLNVSPMQDASTRTEAGEITITPVPVVQKPLPKIAPKPLDTVANQLPEKTEKVPAKDLGSEYPKLKTPSIVLTKSLPQSQKILAKTDRPADKEGVKASPKILPKPVQRSVLKPTTVKHSSKETEKYTPRQSEKVVKTVEKNGTKNAPTKTSARISQKNSQRLHSSKSELHVPIYQLSGSKKLLRKKKARQSDDISSFMPLDTELPVSDKTQLVHGVLLKLLNITSRMPMTKFTDALDSLELLSDAFSLEQRVNITISQDEDEEAKLNNLDQTYYEEYYNFDNATSPIAGNHRITISQVDGPSDLADVVPPETASANNLAAGKRSRTSYIDEIAQLGVVDDSPKNKLQRISL
ncbi:hypothetical protein SK128_018088 [Halocaridina rubra]|uniref:Uncharacterized protein n=1 Tax=Halocaridina rubra TaxID=373956 RepID=A0AAN8X0W9_HALRR